MSTNSIRARKVAEQIKTEIAKIVATEINDPRVHDVVITKARVTNDLATAWVYFSTYDKDALLDIEIGLNRSRGFIRKHLSRLHMRKLPAIIFVKDDTPEAVTRLDELFKELNAKDSERSKELDNNATIDEEGE